MVLLCLVWATDTGAYFVGRRWGGRKLAPKVSPGKTFAGLWGGLGFGLLTAAAAALGLGVGQWPLFVAACLVTVGFAVAGDLYESMVKRQVDVKDSGNLLPGHGGALDRLDSLTAAAPAFALGMTWLFGNPH
jgi:phosphatidate cytidylyltransferase